MTVLRTDQSDETYDDVRSKWRAMRRGFAERCPNCGTGRVFRAYLKVNDQCATCGTELHHHRADDAPPYFTIFIIAHLVIPGLLLTERLLTTPAWVQLAIWIPITVALTLVLLPRVKGALIGLQWALRMHGFGGETDAFDQPIRP